MSVQRPESIPWNPQNTIFPSRKSLPSLPNAPKDAAWVWGRTTSIANHWKLGRVNLLTPERIREAASYIRTGEVAVLKLIPLFHREQFIHEIKSTVPETAFDDIFYMNTQISSQWDGLRHMAHVDSKTFYNGAKTHNFIGPDADSTSCSIHHWASHGIVGRAVLLDYWGYSQKIGITFDHYTAHEITYRDLEQCGKWQGLDIRPTSQGGDIEVGDILLLRTGFIASYNTKDPGEREVAASKPFSEQEFAGLSREESILDWLHDCYFAAVAGDAPAFEAWGTKQSTEGLTYLHEAILALWGMPLGELWDLEVLARMCREQERWIMFLTSSPANVHGAPS
ncbi:hypothetical protein N7512_010627 [Penicillium capsulatum]|nr:hypothetical protein N7512_010627 [Penicillium capsulatum]